MFIRIFNGADLKVQIIYQIAGIRVYDRNFNRNQPEKNHDKLKIACVLMEMRFRQAYCTNKVKCVTAETTCLFAVLWLPIESGRLKKSCGSAIQVHSWHKFIVKYVSSVWWINVLCGDLVQHS
jgi:hypothetical protein